MGDPPGPTAPPYAAPLREEVVRPRRTIKGKGETYFSPFSSYGALGSLRQDPGRAAESSAEAGTCGNWGSRNMCVLLAAYGSRGGVEPVVGLAAQLRTLGAQVRVCGPPDEDFVLRLARVGVPLMPSGVW
jgi:hypothetical protein